MRQFVFKNNILRRFLFLGRLQQAISLLKVIAINLIELLKLENNQKDFVNCSMLIATVAALKF